MDGADTVLREIWKELRNDASERALAIALGAINMAGALHALTPDMVELWQHRIKSCPGHDDEGSRVWCAYCGDIQPEHLKQNE